jgi:hypothetical protein
VNRPSPLPVGVQRAYRNLECRLASDSPRPRACRVCGCTDANCLVCILRTGLPCHWVEEDLCSACIAADVDGGLTPAEIEALGLAEHWTAAAELESGGAA